MTKHSADRSRSGLELRLCSLDLARWLDGEDGGAPPSCGPMFDVAVRRTADVSTVSPIASSGVRFVSPEFLQSVMHAIAFVATSNGSDGAFAWICDRFVDGVAPFDDVPAALRRRGVTAVIPLSEVVRVGNGISAVPADLLRRELEAPFPEHHRTYVVAAGDVRTFFTSAAIHGADVCWLRVPAGAER